MKTIQTAKELLKCLALLALLCLLIECGLGVRTAVRLAQTLPNRIDARAQSLQAAVLAELHAQAGGVRKDAVAQLTALQANVFSELDRTRQMVDRRTGDALARVDTALGTVDALRADLQPTLANVKQITGHANEASAVLLRRDALPAQLLGLTAAAKVTLGQTATTMRAIQQATPQMLATVQQVGDNVRATTEASTEASRNTAQVMANFARATKLLPTWARIGLAVAPPIAQVGASVATTLAVTGKVGK